MATRKFIADTAGELYAVWDGMPAPAYGGTATSWHTPASMAFPYA